MKLSIRDIALIAIPFVLEAISRKPEEKSFLGDMSLPRGIRNNNPGNIKLTNIEWRGKVPRHLNTDLVFEQFYSWHYGVRAMAKQVSNDIARGFNTISKLINKYAPESENVTSNYVRYVSEKTGIPSNAEIAQADVYRLIDAMSRYENYLPPRPEVISLADYQKAIAL